MKKTGLYLYFTVIFLCFAKQSLSQVQRFASQSQLESLREKAPLEKLFVHTDKDSYLLGDTIWYKTYVLDGVHGGPSTISGIVYTELHDAFGNSHFLHMQHLLAGSAHGDMVLDLVGLKPGTYTLRAYTRWLQNFGPDYFFTKTIEIYGDYRQLWALHVNPMQPEDQELHIALSHIDQSPIALQLIEAQIRQGDKILSTQKIVMENDGMLRIPLELSARTDPSKLEITLKGEIDGEARFPLQLALPVEAYDIQILPEGGIWLEDRPALMGVKVLDPQGKGVNYFSGKIFDLTGTEIASFTALRYGMGRVALPALPKGSYTAELTFAKGDTQRVPLPAQAAQGASLHLLSSSLSSKHWQVLLQSSASFQNQTLQLLAVSKGTLCYGRMISAGQTTQSLEIERSSLPEGIVELILANAEGTPIAARRVFNAGNSHQLQANLSFDKEAYSTQEEVVLELELKDAAGNPVIGNLSLAITDDQQYVGAAFAQNIYNHYFLASEIQGHIEEPGYYFSEDKDATEALDNLLLTQGWIRYDQSLLTGFFSPALKAEPYFEISGQVVNVSGKGIPKAKVNLMGMGVPVIAMDTLTDAQGRFAFNHTLPPFARMGFVVTSQNARGGSFNMGLLLNPDTPKPSIPKTANSLRTPWYAKLDYTQKQQITLQEEYRIHVNYGDSIGSLRRVLLEEVEILSKKTIKNSRNLNGPGKADLSFNDEDVLSKPDRSLYEFLLDSIPGLGIKNHRIFGLNYVWKSKKIVFIIDGIRLEDIFVGYFDPLSAITAYLQSIPVSDVLGTEVFYNSRYNNRYHAIYLDVETRLKGENVEVAYIEVTTRAGDGTVRQKAGTDYQYDIQFHWPRQFYAPRYTNNNLLGRKDLRSTIHWEPLWLTNPDGKATLRFFTSEQKGSYTLHLQGMDEHGHFVVKKEKIYIN